MSPINIVVFNGFRMNKFQKRISKNIRNHPNDCLVIGDGFGHIQDFLGIFNTVFVLESTLELKVKNLIQRKDFQSVFQLANVSGVFIDLDKVEFIDNISPLLTKGPDMFVEGNDVLERKYTKVLYQLGYVAVAQLGYMHQWSSRGV